MDESGVLFILVVCEIDSLMQRCRNIEVISQLEKFWGRNKKIIFGYCMQVVMDFRYYIWVEIYKKDQVG